VYLISVVLIFVVHAGKGKTKGCTTGAERERKE